MLTLALGRAVVVLTVIAIAGRRGSADLAQTLYARHEPAASSLRTPPWRWTAQDGTTAGPRPGGRPSKRDRAQAAALKRHGGNI